MPAPLTPASPSARYVREAALVQSERISAATRDKEAAAAAAAAPVRTCDARRPTPTCA